MNLTNKLNLFVFILMLLMSACGKLSHHNNDDNLDYEKLLTKIDSIKIENIVELVAQGPSIHIYVSVENRDTLPYNLWFVTKNILWSSPFHNSNIWGEVVDTIYSMTIPRSSGLDTSLNIPPNTSVTLDVLLREKISSYTLRDIRNEYAALFDKDFLVKIVNMHDNDTLIFRKSTDFKTIYTLDYQNIHSNDSAKMNVRRIDYNWMDDFDNIP